jgi:hypothetical protein
VTLVGRAAEMEPRHEELEAALLRHVDSWRTRATHR